LKEPQLGRENREKKWHREQATILRGSKKHIREKKVVCRTFAAEKIHLYGEKKQKSSDLLFTEKRKCRITGTFEGRTG